MTEPLHISRIKFHDILGIEELEFEPGAFTVITGPNGSGKTSILDGIRAAVGQGEKGQLLRVGAEEGEAVLILSDGTEIKRRISDSRDDTTVKESGKPKERAPATYVKALIDAWSVNPVDLLKAKPDKRLQVLLETVPLDVDVSRLTEIAGFEVTNDDDVPALTLIERTYDAIYSDRTATNRAKEQKKGTISQLSAALPADEAGAPTGSLEELQAQVAAINAAEAAEMTRIDTKLTGLRTELVENIDVRQKQIDALQTQIEGIRQSIAEERSAFAQTESAAAAQRARKVTDFSTQRTPIEVQIAGIRNNERAAIAAETTRANIRILRKDVDELEADAERQTSALDALKAYKSELLAKLPVEGLEVKDGLIYRHGVVFDRLNKAQQVEIAVELARLRAGDLAVMCVDDLESLDTEHFEAFRDMARKSGLQLFVTRVSDDDLHIETDAPQGE